MRISDERLDLIKREAYIRGYLDAISEVGNSNETLKTELLDREFEMYCGGMDCDKCEYNVLDCKAEFIKDYERKNK